MAQSGSALDWGSRGRWFESSRSDHFFNMPLLSTSLAVGCFQQFLLREHLWLHCQPHDSRGALMINRTIGLLGLLASILALSSLIAGAFQEPLGPYMNGVLGGLLEAYRAMRDMLFSGLGFIFSGLINWAGQWLDWLLPAPWFTMPASLKDLLAFYSLLFASMHRTRRDSAYKEIRNKTYRPDERETTWQSAWEQLSYAGKYMTKHLAIMMLGSGVFFLLVYAENRVGL